MTTGYTVHRPPKGASFNPWRATLDLRDLKRAAGPLVSGSALIVFAKAVAARLKELPDYRRALEPQDATLYDAATLFDEAKDWDDVNEAVNRLYDWGDEARVIVELGR